MFSIQEKIKIADAIEKILLEIDHPEMPKEGVDFSLHVNGKEGWSFADIIPNWKVKLIEENKDNWNEVSRRVFEILSEEAEKNK